MPYGTVKVDNITFDNGGADQTVTVSGLYRATTSGVTVTGTVSGQRVEAVSGVIANISGTNATFTSALIPTANIVSGVFASGTANNPSITFTGDLNTGFYAPAIDQIAITTAGGERIRIQEDGDVGIGTNSPEAKLHVLENASTPGVFIRQTGAGSALTVSGSSAFSGVVTATGTITAASFIPTSTGIPTNGIYLPSANTVGVATNTTGRLFVDGSGNVSIRKTIYNSLFNVHATDNVLTNYPIRVDNNADNYGTGYGAYGLSNRVNALNQSVDYTFDIGDNAIFKTQDTERMRIRGDGKVAIGGTGNANVLLYNQGAVTGGTTVYAIASDGEVQSDVTASGIGTYAALRVQNTTFTLSNLIQFFAAQGTIGASATVTNQFGFNASSNLVGAVNNYGFFGDIPSGTGRWNFYANGTANNFFNGSVGIGTTSITEKLTVSGNAAISGNLQAASINNSTLLNYVYLTTPGSGTYTPTAGTKRILVEVWGAGGGGGGADGKGASTWGKGGAGGGGGYCSKWIASGLAAGYSYTVGAGGTGGAGAAGDGGAGGASSFSGTGVSLTANGGNGGVGVNGQANGTNTTSAVGGTATGGDINIRGGASESVITTAATIRTASPGSGYSFPQANWTGGVGPSSGGVGQDGQNPAEGGGGGVTRDIVTNYAGGAGAPGLIKITEYFV